MWLFLSYLKQAELSTVSSVLLARLYDEGGVIERMRKRVGRNVRIRLQGQDS